MTQEHAITPPPELVEQWLESTRSDDCIGVYPTDFEQRICTAAARWAADQELEACCHEVQKLYGVGRWLRSIRRPKPPSLKEQALAELDLLKADTTTHGLGFDAPAIRRALESLPD